MRNERQKERKEQIASAVAEIKELPGETQKKTAVMNLMRNILK